MSFLASILAQLVVGIIQQMHARADFRAAVLREVEAKGAEDALTAMGWKAAHPVPDAPGIDVFAVREGAPEIKR